MNLSLTNELLSQIEQQGLDTIVILFDSSNNIVGVFPSWNTLKETDYAFCPFSFPSVF